MIEWLEQASQWHEMYCRDLEVMSSNPSQVKLGVCSISALSRRPTWTKHIFIDAPLAQVAHQYYSNGLGNLGHKNRIYFTVCISYHPSSCYIQVLFDLFHPSIKTCHYHVHHTVQSNSPESQGVQGHHCKIIFFKWNSNLYLYIKIFTICFSAWSMCNKIQIWWKFSHLILFNTLQTICKMYSNNHMQYYLGGGRFGEWESRVAYHTYSPTQVLGWWVCMLCYPLFPFLRPPTSQIILPVVPTSVYPVSYESTIV